jgi:hypothetical protein
MSKQVEMIMSTLALPLAGLTAPATDTTAEPGLWKRFIQARQARIDRMFRAYLATMSEADLARSGWAETQMRSLRNLTQGGEVS